VYSVGLRKIIGFQAMFFGEWAAMGKIVISTVFMLAGALAQAEFSIRSSVIGSSSGPSSSETYRIVGTLGQPAAQVSGGESSVLSGGFWAGNHGCVVQLTDLVLLAEAWLSGPAQSGYDLGDFSTLAGYWLGLCPAEWPLK
jgi:hypothetical protein